jgi:tetratricopeptide (TPR) repeat protein
MKHRSPRKNQEPGSSPGLNRAVQWHQVGKLDLAENEYVRVLRAQPDQFDALHGLGTLQAQQSRYGEALQNLSAAVKLRPNDIGALSNLGIAYANLGRSSEALSCYDRALALKPDFPEALANRGDALRSLKRPEEALDSYNRAVALSPGVADIFNNRSGAFRDLNRIQEALEDCERALALKPDHVGAHNNRGCALQNLNRLAEAIVCFDEALAIDPKFIPAHVNRGHVLKDSGRARAALDNYDKALALMPDCAEAHDGKGLALMELGRLEEAKQSIEKAVAISPRKAGFYYNLTTVMRIGPDDRRFHTMLDLAKAPQSLDGGEQIFLQFALAKTFAGIGDHERSFQHLERGNTLKRKQIIYNETPIIGSLKRIKKAFSIKTMQQYARLGDPSDAPLFIVGMPRSGTTLVEQILAAHPKIFAAGETDDFAKAMLACGGPIANGINFPESVSQTSPNAWRDLGERYIERVRSYAPDAERIVNKLPENFRLVGFIRLAFPNARIIHTRRHPVDTCLSCYSHLFTGYIPYAYDLGELGRYYKAYQTLTEHWRQILPPDAWLEVQYEKLVADFEPQARRIISHCGLDWDDRCLTFHQVERQVRTASAVQVRKPIYAESVGRWRPYKFFLDPLIAELGPSINLGDSFEWRSEPERTRQSPPRIFEKIWRFMARRQPIASNDA